MTSLLALTLATGTAAAAPTTGAYFVPQPHRYTLAADTEDGPSGTDLQELERRMNIAHGFYGVGSFGMVGGTITAAAGAVVGIIGLFPAVISGDETMMVAGFATAAVGVGVVAISVPVFLTASWTGAAVLRHHGIHVSRVPGWVMLGGLATVVVGAVADSGPAAAIGVVGMLGGGTTQVITTRRAFRAYDSQQQAATAQAALVPRWSPDGGAGLSLVVTF